MTSPPWLQASLAAPRSAPESGLATLARPGGIVGIAGGAGSGKTALAASLARASGTTIVAVRVAGCRTTEDARLAVGLAIGALPPGDPSEVASALRRLGSPIVVLDEVDDQRVAGVIEELGALAPEVRWLATGERDLWPAQTLRLAAPTAKGPSIEEALRGAGFDPPWSCLDQLSAEAQALACLPAGLKTDAIDVPKVLRVRLGPGRTALRRAAIAAMPAELLPEPSRAAARLAPLLESALGLAIGAPLPDDLGLPDLLALRWLGEVLRDPDDAPRATAAAARLLMAWGLAGEARRLAQAALRRETQASHQARALLCWAEADAAHAQGRIQEASEGYAAARKVAKEVEDIDLMGVMARQQALRLGERGAVEASAQAWREARLLARGAGDMAAVATTLRGAADLAVARGEVLSAETLYDQDDATPAERLELANRRLGEAGLALGRGELARASRLIEAASTEELDVPVLRAVALRRRAELALRRGQHADARRLARDAAVAFGRAGEAVARGHSLRLVGDAAAAQGALVAAAEAYAEAMALQVRIDDRHGLSRTLAHARALADDAGLDELSARLDGHAQALYDAQRPVEDRTLPEVSIPDPGDLSA